MRKLKLYFRNHGTKILGFIGGIVSALAGTGIIPAHQLKYYLAVGSVATFVRGFTNTRNARDAS